MTASISDIDDLCIRHYTSTTMAVRLEAQARLEQLTSNEANRDGSIYMTVLEQSTNQYSLMYCAQSMVLWFKASEKQFSPALQGQIILTVVDSVRRLKSAQAPRHIIAAIVTCVAKLTKLGCETEPLLLTGVHEALRMVSEAIGAQAVGLPNTPPASPVPPHRKPGQVVDCSNDLALGLQLLNSIVTEFNLYDSSKQQTFMNFASHRRRSNNFKDSILLPIFITSLTCLENINPDAANAEVQLTTASSRAQLSAASGLGLTQCVGDVVLLIKNCLTYDFMAIIVDETEDALSSQFPTTWKETLLSSRCLDLLWGQHAALRYPHCATLLQAISSICGVRRSFFDTPEEKNQFLAHCMDRICDVESIPDDRLKDSHYCSVMAECINKFVAPFGYKDLAASPSFERWIRFAERLSQGVFSCLFGQDGSFSTTTTMLQFWGRLCNSKRMYLGDDDRSRDIENVVPQLALAFFTSRTTPWQEVDLDEELTESVLTQVDSFPPLVLIAPAQTLQLLHAHLQSIGPAVLSTPASLGWLMYLAGCIVRGVFQAVDDTCIEACSYFLLVAVEVANRRRTDSSSGSDSSAFHDFVEGGMLHFLTAIQLVFTSSRTSNVITKILTNVFEEKVKLFHFVLFTVGHNITRDPNSSNGSSGDPVAIVRASIDLIGESCRDVPTAIMKELRLDLPPVVQLPLSQHTLSYKLRTNLQAALWLLRSSAETYNVSVLTLFLQPIEELMRQTCERGLTDPLFVAGWLRDLRGVSRGTSSNQASFTDFVDWVIDHAPYFTEVLKIRPVSPMIVIGLLRFLSELVTTSRYGKVNLPTSAHCASGIMLFKFICSILQDTLAVTITDEQLAQVSQGHIPDGVYRFLLKPLCLSMDIMRKCLHGDFVPFGAMQLYKDDCFDVTTVGMFRMLSVFPMHLFKQYTKAAFAVLDLLRSLTELNVISPLAQMDSDEISRLIQFCIYMCSDVDTNSGALIHGMNFLSFIAQLVGSVKLMITSPSLSPQPSASDTSSGGSSRGQPRSSRRLREAIAKTLAPHTDLWSTLIYMAMNIVVCQDRALSACCSVVYPIFEADPNFWYQFANDFATTYPAAKQAAVQEALSALAAVAESQEKFFAEVFLFRNKIRNL